MHCTRQSCVWGGVLSGSSVSCQPHNLINEYFRMVVIRNSHSSMRSYSRLSFTLTIKEHPDAVPKVQKERVKVTPVAHNDTSRLHLYLLCGSIVCRLSICNLHIFRKQCSEIQ